MEQTSEQAVESPSMMTYVIGTVLVVAIIAGALYFRSKSAKSPVVTPPGEQPIAITSPPPRPISGLGCDQQYYNPKIGFEEYYLSATGGDVAGATNVTCTFTAKVDGAVIATATAQGPLSNAPQRGGSTFVCTTDAIEFTPNVPTVVDVALVDNLNAKATCSATFTFPSP